ncbi:hypothetical protein SNE40_018207 [Patella caerulea]|uniref:PiggyBac transposable element-derived protein domain-containing protein n=1 Tax=Patella caerulea TaxID=87958 RepID=A0AAN8J8C4_PATCE
MSRNRFCEIKKYIHLANNEGINVNDKAAKVRPFIDSINQGLVQFGVFSKDLSGDEQMVPYFGKHSAKMFMRNKPVKFGYKFWILASTQGFPYKIDLYCGKETNKTKTNKTKTGTVGASVIFNLLTVVENPKAHTITFDNFFTDYDLLKGLADKGFAATGTVRENRMKGAILPKSRSMKKKIVARRTTEFCSTGSIVACCWKDNKPVYCMSNYLGVTPTEKKRRYSQQEKKHIHIECPQMIASYNKTIGELICVTDSSVHTDQP